MAASRAMAASSKYVSHVRLFLMGEALHGPGARTGYDAAKIEMAN
jgi:hypothetical protein